MLSHNGGCLLFYCLFKLFVIIGVLKTITKLVLIVNHKKRTLMTSGGTYERI